MAAGDEHRYPQSFSPEGRLLVYRVGRSSPFDLGLLSLGDDAAAAPLLEAPFDELEAEISPDGRWLAYVSNESGRKEVYVRPFPAVDEGEVQVSTAGGESPLWSRDGGELFYRVAGAAASRMMAVSVEARDDRPVYADPELLFEGDYLFGISGRNYDDGAAP